jgi:hypothetical protein
MVVNLLVYPLMLTLTQYLSDKINIERSKRRQDIAAFAAAIAISYLILVFLPETYSGGLSVVFFFPILIGFTTIHVFEKLIYKKFSGSVSLKRRHTYHDELHAIILFVYHFVIGVVIINLLRNDFETGLLFIPPLLLFATIGNWSVHHHYVTKTTWIRVVLASSTMLGAISATFITYPEVVHKSLLSFAAGILLFIIVRESLPKEKKGNPLLFTLGVLFYSGIILFLQ